MDYYVSDTKYAYDFRLGNHLETEYRQELDEAHETCPVSHQNPKESTKKSYIQKIIVILNN